MSWTKMSRRILIVLMCGLMLGVSACTEAQKEQAAAAAEQRKRTFAERALKERASEYWNLVRWRTWDNAASYLEDEAEQPVRLSYAQVAAWLRLSYARTYASIQGTEFPEGGLRLHDVENTHFTMRHLFVAVSRAHRKDQISVAE